MSATQNVPIGASTAAMRWAAASVQNGGYFATARDLGGIRSVMQEAA
jgi:hypothetical protein